MKIIRLVLKPLLSWAAYRTWSGRNRCREKPALGRLTSPDVRRILARGWRNFDLLAPHLPRTQTLGNRQNMVLACVTLSLFQSLVAEGVDRAYAIELIADAAWKVYEKWGVLPRVIAHVKTRDSLERMRTMVGLFLRYPFNPPGYQFDFFTRDNTVVVDMRRCPIAEYLQSQQAADLCVGSWCSLDFALAEMWGGRLECTSTLASGALRCDFRFIASR
jgi:L-2-amino-thiazoline-4-carboxylic acid hydrolase